MAVGKSMAAVHVPSSFGMMLPKAPVAWDAPDERLSWSAATDHTTEVGLPSVEAHPVPEIVSVSSGLATPV